MWQAPDLKRRAQAAAERSAKQRRKNAASNFRLQKTMAELRAAPEGEPEIRSSAQVLLNDITPTGMNLFSDCEIQPGDFVEITLKEPQLAYVRARVTLCQEITSEIRVISAHRFPFRMSVVFMFSSEEEERAFNAFVGELRKLLSAP